MLRDAVLFFVGFGIGWLVFKQPQFVVDAWQWIKHKVHPDKPVT